MKLAFVFPGQGSQKVGMGRDLHEGLDEVKRLYEKASEALGYDVARLSFEGPEEELNRTERTQPCLLAASMASYLALASRGVRADIMAGHSLGEYTALVAAGALPLAHALRATELRGRLMQEAVPEGKGLMAAVLGLERARVQEVCRSVASGYVAPANYNCPGQIVISGERPAVEEAVERLKEAGAKRALALAVSVPSHSRLMEPAAERLAEHLREVPMREPSVPVVGNADARVMGSVQEIKDALVRQLKGPVLWEESVGLMARSGVETFVEAGPGKVLAGLVRRCAPDARALGVEDRESLASTLSALAP
ncbi:MAG: ACP S-malonyltransferase [Nitrospirota bacterium]